MSEVQCLCFGNALQGGLGPTREEEKGGGHSVCILLLLLHTDIFGGMRRPPSYCSYCAGNAFVAIEHISVHNVVIRQGLTRN